MRLSRQPIITMPKIKVMFRYLVELKILNHQPNIEKSYNVLIIVSDFKFIIQITKLISFENLLWKMS